jgi:hypothetical protein
LRHSIANTLTEISIRLNAVGAGRSTSSSNLLHQPLRAMVCNLRLEIAPSRTFLGRRSRSQSNSDVDREDEAPAVDKVAPIGHFIMAACIDEYRSFRHILRAMTPAILLRAYPHFSEEPKFGNGFSIARTLLCDLFLI